MAFFNSRMVFTSIKIKYETHDDCNMTNYNYYEVNDTWLKVITYLVSHQVFLFIAKPWRWLRTLICNRSWNLYLCIMIIIEIMIVILGWYLKSYGVSLIVAKIIDSFKFQGFDVFVVRIFFFFDHNEYYKFKQKV